MTQASHQKLSGIFIPDEADKARAVAELFCCLYGDEQAAFFNHMADISGGWENPNSFQWANMAGHLTEEGRRVLRHMAEIATS